MGNRFPDFSIIQEFKRFVAKLDEEEIQRFSYDDWLELYDKIGNLAQSQIFKDVRREHEPEIKELLEQSGRSNSESLSNTQFLANFLCLDEFIKLNRNFKPSEQDFRVIQTYAKAIAQNLHLMNADTAKTLTDNEHKFFIGHTVDNKALELTSYPTNRYEEKLNSNFGFDSATTSHAYVEHNTYNSNIFYQPEKRYDGFIETAVHEAIHAHFQQSTAAQRDLAKKNIYPLGLSTELSKIFNKNSGFYIRGDYIKLFCGNDDQKFKGYSRQPTEYTAKLAGMVAERHFRAISGQYSERSFILTDNYLRHFKGCSFPLSSRYRAGQIEAFYDIKDFNTIKKVHQGLPKPLKESVKLYKSEKAVKLTFSTDWKTKNLLNKHFKKKVRNSLIKKSILPMVLKKIPFISIGVGGWLAYKRFKNGEKNVFICQELLSGLFSCVPGWGTLQSALLDVNLLFADVVDERYRYAVSVHSQNLVTYKISGSAYNVAASEIKNYLQQVTTSKERSLSRKILGLTKTKLPQKMQKLSHNLSKFFKSRD